MCVQLVRVDSAKLSQIKAAKDRNDHDAPYQVATVTTVYNNRSQIHHLLGEKHRVQSHLHSSESGERKHR